MYLSWAAGGFGGIPVHLHGALVAASRLWGQDGERGVVVRRMGAGP